MAFRCSGIIYFGTWEILPGRIGFSKRFLTFKADGTSKAIRVTNDHGSPRRAENKGTWRVNHGYLKREVIKATHDVGAPFNIGVQIESIENGRVKLRYENGDKEELRRISHLPSLPPLLASAATWVPELSAAEAREATVSSPQPDYPLVARQSRIQGSGIFRLIVAKDGRVDSIQVRKSKGSKILDDAAKRALKQWHFKPRVVQAVNVPINFVLTRGQIDTGEPKALALYAPRPACPYEARDKRLTGSGTVLVNVDSLTGSVTSAQMLKSTGYKVLDDSALPFVNGTSSPAVCEKCEFRSILRARYFLLMEFRCAFIRSSVA